MADQAERHAIAVRDLITGACILALGTVAGYEARDFDEASRLFPMVTGVLLAIAGLAIAIHAIAKPGIQNQVPGLATPLLACAVIAAWALAFAAGFGFAGPTFVMQLALMWIAGIRNKATLLITAALVTALAVLLFVTLLDVPLPPSRLPTLLQGI